MVDRTGPEAEFALARVKDADAHQVSGQQVGSTLDAGKAKVQRTGDGAAEHGLADTRNIVHQQMTFAEQSYSHKLDGRALAEDDLFDLIAKLLAEFLNCGYGH